MGDFFPPNLDDGELWLPSEIIHEITSANVTPKNKTIHYTSVPFLPEPKNPAARSLPYVAPKIGNGFFGAPYVDHSPCATSFGGYEVVPGPINLYNPITQTQNQDFKKRAGTGVFLPHTASYFEEPRETRGTGVFLNDQPKLASQRKKKSGKNGQEKYTTKEETPGEEEEQIRLPNDWIY